MSFIPSPPVRPMADMTHWLIWSALANMKSQNSNVPATTPTDRPHQRAYVGKWMRGMSRDGTTNA